MWLSNRKATIIDSQLRQYLSVILRFMVVVSLHVKHCGVAYMRAMLHCCLNIHRRLYWRLQRGAQAQPFWPLWFVGRMSSVSDFSTLEHAYHISPTSWLIYGAEAVVYANDRVSSFQ